MPIYEYRCEQCGHELEAIQKMSDDPLVDCPECGKPALTKLISAAGFRLKGGGWYETDFKSKNRKNVVSEGKESPGKKEGSKGGGAKSKSEGKKSDKPSSGGNKKAAS